ncbi:MAG: hypothetical protein HWD92_03450 [Flavobacteriia bacterium]|nr:hypothetical protein [Flavobacteriia bacterium]
MKKLTFSLLAIGFIASSCNRVGFPTKEDMVGTWIEQDPYADTLIFRGDNSLIRMRSGVTDTVEYITDHEEGLVRFFDSDNPAFSERKYKVLQLGGPGTMSLVKYRGTVDGYFDRQ